MYDFHVLWSYAAHILHVSQIYSMAKIDLISISNQFQILFTDYLKEDLQIKYALITSTSWDSGSCNQSQQAFKVSHLSGP